MKFNRKKHKPAKEKKIVDAEIKNEEVPQEAEAAAEAETEATSDDGAVEAETVDAGALQGLLEKAKAQAEEYLNLAQHVQADFNNFRRRNESVRADSFAEGQRDVVKAMLPVLDNLERALDAAGEDSPLKNGVELTLKQMRSAFEKLGVTEISRQGEKFDPNLENAVMQGEPGDGEPGTVCMVLQKGYMMGKTVVRHAMVKVVPD